MAPPALLSGILDSGDVLSLYTFGGTDLLDYVNFLTFQSDATAKVTATAFPAFNGLTTQLDPTKLTAIGNDSATSWCTSFYPATGVRSRVTDTLGADNGSCSIAVINEVLIDAPAPTTERPSSSSLAPEAATSEELR
ncbi:MAG: hypothetical protein U0165_15665 [Polyangiaceae bacterium]